ncbi:MAG: hypothetical protein OXU51_05200 [Candidatus Poribacteria bacterium]|nr:hypothetical protein [Candidatus Poribacteria bacterium]
MEYEIFSERQKRIQGEIPDTYQYETIPKELRFQVLRIWEKVWGTAYYNDFEELQLSPLAMDAYRSIEAELCEEYGVPFLDGVDVPDEDGYNFYWAVRYTLLEMEDTKKVLDVIEVSFRYIDREIRDKFYVPNDDGLDDMFGLRHRDISYDGIPPDEAIDLLNRRFHQRRVGYQYESGQIMKVDSQFTHSKVVKPALMFLSDPIYRGANEEFLKAHEHYRDGNYKDCINNCLKAFESCLKVICQKQGWNYGKRDTANRLIDTVFKHKLIDSSMTCHFTALISTLKSGVPTVRNDQSAHGQGSEDIIVPEYIASYILHLTASNILLLAKADEDMK